MWLASGKGREEWCDEQFLDLVPTETRWLEGKHPLGMSARRVVAAYAEQSSGLCIAWKVLFHKVIPIFYVQVQGILHFISYQVFFSDKYYSLSRTSHKKK